MPQVKVASQGCNHGARVSREKQKENKKDHRSFLSWCWTWELMAFHQAELGYYIPAHDLNKVFKQENGCPILYKWDSSGAQP